VERSLADAELFRYSGGRAAGGQLCLCLKKLLAEKELDIDMLKEVSQGNF
jgi:hypothetical protein